MVKDNLEQKQRSGLDHSVQIDLLTLNHQHHLILHIAFKIHQIERNLFNIDLETNFTLPYVIDSYMIFTFFSNTVLTNYLSLLTELDSCLKCRFCVLHIENQLLSWPFGW